MNAPRPEPKIVVERTFKTDVATLWDLWTTKAGFESWWGPQGFHVEVSELNLKEGGEFRYDIIADREADRRALADMGRPDRHPTTMRFIELVPGQRILFRSRIDFFPGVRPYDNDLAIDFANDGEKTRMKVTQEGLHTDEVTKQSKEGLESALAKLDARFPK
ncbi:MAG: SRPBCC family protein [Archangium sp.]